jgi:phosphoribosylformylglycinamidine (FGAM) synthase-like enzyme
LLVAIAEMAMAGKRGVALDAPPADIPAHAIWFGEDQGRYVVSATPDKVDTIKDVAAVYSVPVRVLGTVGGDTLTLPGEAPLPLGMLRAAYEDWLPRFMTRG